MSGTFGARHLAELRAAVASGAAVLDAVARVGGGTTLAGGMWRIHRARTRESWRDAWNALTDEFEAFGEDVFGNQLVLRPRLETAWLWDHESGEFDDLLLDIPTLFDCVDTDGLAWLDPYSAGQPDAALARMRDLKEAQHLHWITPLILGGRCESVNLEPIAREDHLHAHADILRQIRGLPPGSVVVPR